MRANPSRDFWVALNNLGPDEAKRVCSIRTHTRSGWEKIVLNIADAEDLCD